MLVNIQKKKKTCSGWIQTVSKVWKEQETYGNNKQ